jgi:hypothetical protein
VVADRSIELEFVFDRLGEASLGQAYRLLLLSSGAQCRKG